MITQIGKTPEETTGELRQAIGGKLKALFPNGVRRVALIHPLPFSIGHFSAAQAKRKRYYAWPPYGMAVLCRMLKKRGYEVKLLDLNYELLSYAHREEDNEKIEKEIVTLWKTKTKEFLENFNPDLVGLTCMFTMTHQMMCEVAEYSKELRPQTPVFAGGVHVTNAPEFVLNATPAIDAVGIYESDVSFGNIVDFLNDRAGIDKLSQVATILDSKFSAIRDRAQPTPEELDIAPDYDELPIGEYAALGELGSYRCWLPAGTKSSSSISNRGCRAHCSFCSVANFNGKGVRQRNVDSVVDEIAYLKEHHGVTHITWLDDDLFYNKNRAIEMFNKFVQRRLGITWCASNGVIASATSSAPELLHAAAESGCVGMTFGVESGSDKILRDVHKPSGVKHFLKVGEMMAQYPQIFTRGFLIVGFPNETLAQIQETISMSQNMALDWYGIQLLSPLPNTEIYETMVDLGLITDNEFKKNSEKDGSTLFVVRQGEKQRAREEQGRLIADNFSNPFATTELDVVPSREQLHDLWLLVDYWINYDPILRMDHPMKLKKKQCILTDVCDRMTRQNPLANLFLGIVEEKLNNKVAALRRFNLAREYLSTSAYWQKRFEVLNLMTINVSSWQTVAAGLQFGQIIVNAEQVDHNLRNSGYTV